MSFKNENVAAGLRREDLFHIGKTEVDPGEVVEHKVLLPWPADPKASWVYYDCTVEVMLDSGIAVHNHLPQASNTPDTLASCLLDDPKLDILTGRGVALASRDQYEDIVQRMAHSRYWFRLYGQALRVGKRIPIPGIETIGGVPAVPYDKHPQFAFNRIFPGGNYGGIILWHAAWSLWYTTAVPPRSDEIPAIDAATHISSKTKGPSDKGMQAPYSQPSDGSVPTAPGGGHIGKPPGPGFIGPVK